MACVATFSTQLDYSADLLSFSSSPPHLSSFSWKKNAPLTRSSSYRLGRITAKLSPQPSGPHHTVSDGDSLLMDRRELMASSVVGFSLLTPQLAVADPIATPDLNKCELATVTSRTEGVSASKVLCCVPGSKSAPVDFVFEKKPPEKLRRGAHKVDVDYIAKYNKAYKFMKNLPPSDPRSFKAQADVHCAFCNGAYTQTGNAAKLQIHFSWLFLPWHRWYLYFHERILGSLIGDPNFALVYWDWADQQQGGNVMPAMFLPTDSALYDSKRDQNHLPPNLVNLSLGSNATDPDQIIKENLNDMYQSVVKPKTPRLFMGGEYTAGDSVESSSGIAGTIESGPHTAVHAWTGDKRETYREDMGNFYSAGRDPIFYAHHSNVDRVWNVWTNLGGRRRKPHDDPDFLNAQFLFYDENARLVRVNVKDSLDAKRLGIFYQRAPTDELWFKYEPQPLSTTRADVSRISELGPAIQNKIRKDVGKKLASKAARPSAPPQNLFDKGIEAEDVEEVLVLEGVQLPTNALVQLVVFINLPDADENTPTTGPEYVGSFTNIPHTGMTMDRITTIRFPITDNINRLGISDLSNLAVTVVPRGGDTNVSIKIKGIKIEYE